MRKVCVTGFGIVSSIGTGIDAFHASLLSGKSGIRIVHRAEASHVSPPTHVAGQVDINFAEHLPPTRIAGLDRVSLLALVAAQQAVQSANIGCTALELQSAGVYIGTGIGGIHALESAYEDFFLRGGKRIKPLSVVQAMNNAAAAHIAMAYCCHGPVITYSTACSSSAMAIGEAYRAIKHGYANTVIAGGTEAMLTPGTLKGWDALRTLALPDTANPAASCKPFARDRTGLVLAEGAAVVVLEDAEHARRRGASIIAMLSGYGCGTDATHLTKPDAAGQAATMNSALEEAGLLAEKIDYINAHGTATIAGDIIESSAIKMVFGNRAYRVPVSSTKSMHGHVMGATGAVEFIASLVALQRSFIPPTMHLEQPDPECDLDYVANLSRQNVRLNHVMSNSFAFGGSNAVLIASRV